MQILHLQILYLNSWKGKGQSAKDARKDLNGGVLRVGATEDQRTLVGVSWLAAYASEHANARLRKAQLAALKANRGGRPSAQEMNEAGCRSCP